MYNNIYYFIVKKLKASLVQLVERRSPKSGVEGSSPSGRVFNGGSKQIKYRNIINNLWLKKSKHLLN